MIGAKFKKLAVCILCGYGGFCSGQGSSGSEMDNKYTPNQSSIFNNLYRKNSDLTSGYAANYIKFYPLALLRQKVLLSYQRSVVNGLAVELGLGKAFGTDIFQVGNLALFHDLFENSLSPGQIFSNSKYSSSTPFLMLAAKMYYSGKAPDDGYIEVSIRREKLSYLLNNTVDGWPVFGSQVASFKMTALTVGIGYTTGTGDTKRITHDFFVNVGIKFFSYSRFEQVADANNQITYVKSSSDASARVMPAINMGYSLGFGF
jgi:hypothetical protein